jgi:hypothetical protein
MLDQKQITKQMIQFNKTAFDNSFKAMAMVYEQSERVTETFMTQANWLPEEGKKAIKDWMSAYRQGCDDFKKLVEENYAKVETYFSE